MHCTQDLPKPETWQLTSSYNRIDGPLAEGCFPNSCAPLLRGDGYLELIKSNLIVESTIDLRAESLGWIVAGINRSRPHARRLNWRRRSKAKFPEVFDHERFLFSRFI
jgi:hypothetical protein